MRVTFLWRGAGRVPVAEVREKLLDVLDPAPATAEIGRWTEIERLQAYDWATRVVRRRNGDKLVNKRPMPFFLVPWKELQGEGIE